MKGCKVPYGLSKVGVESLTKKLGKDMASKCIVVNGNAPGATATSMLKFKNQNV
jgi:NAD(P)-dependent dehydrogenase (short-subunit alcohol dehydrogenase family)